MNIEHKGAIALLALPDSDTIDTFASECLDT